ncbi:1,4-beta-N-acetylmuramidase [Oenococcus sp. UCMA 17063]|nr:1,4-beta-N-acetylmuramidase [Oenococcus sp. UCMA 17063]
MENKNLKKYQLLIPLLLSSALAETSMIAPSVLVHQQRAYATSTSTNYASITSSTNVSYTAVVVEDNRNDGIYTSGPALTSASTMTASVKASTYNGHTVQVEKIDSTKRSNGMVYQYAQVKDGTATYWIDLRALTRIDSITGTQTLGDSYSYINQTKRSDGIYTSGPALTSASTMTANKKGSNYNGDKVQIEQIDTTKRASNGATYEYAKVKDGSSTFWIDQRALFDQVSYTNNVQYQAHINQTKRSDSVYYDGAPYTSTDTLKASTSAAQFNGDSVTVQKTSVQERYNGTSYTYVEVYDQTKNKYYWIDQRALFDQVLSTNATQSQGYIDQSTRNDGVYYNDAPYTSTSTLAASTSAAQFNGDPVTIEKTSVQERYNGTSYTYVEVYDQTKKEYYWIDKRAVSTYATITSSTAMNQTAQIYEGSRNDGIYTSGPAYTSAATMVANGSASTYNGDSVTILKSDVTKRSNGLIYTYYQVKDGSSTFWIDSRGVTQKVLNISTSGLTTAQKNWLNNIAPAAAEVADSNGLYASVMVAQAILESNWGTSKLAAAPYNNLFGIKASYSPYISGYSSFSTTEYVGSQYVTVNSSFNTYSSVTNSFYDYLYKMNYGVTWNTSLYHNIFRSVAGSYSQAAKNLVTDGYATDPKYSTKLIDLINSYKLYNLD